MCRLNLHLKCCKVPTSHVLVIYVSVLLFVLHEIGITLAIFSAYGMMPSSKDVLTRYHNGSVTSADMV